MSAQDSFEEHVRDLAKLDKDLAAELREAAREIAEFYSNRRELIAANPTSSLAGLSLSENAQRDRKLNSDLELQDIFSGDTIYTKWGVGNARALLNYERALIAEDNRALAKHTSPNAQAFSFEQETGLYRTSNVVLDHDEYPLQPQGDAFRRTDRGPLENLGYPKPSVDEIIEISADTFDPTARLHRHFRDSMPPAQDIGFTETDGDGNTSVVIGINARAEAAVRTFVAKIDIPQPTTPTLPTTLFDQIPLPSDGIVVAARTTSENTIQTAMAGKPNAAINYIRSVRTELATLKGEAYKSYVDETLVPDRDYVLARLEANTEIGSSLGILQGLDTFLKREIAKVYPVANPTFETVDAVAAAAPAVVQETPVIAKKPPIHKPPVLTTVHGPEAETLPLPVAEKSAPVRTPPKFVPTLTTVIEEGELAAMSARRPARKENDIWTKEILTKANIHVMDAVTNAKPENRQTLLNDIARMRKEAFEELAKRSKNGASYEETQHIFEQRDFLAVQAGLLKNQIEEDRQTRAAKLAQPAETTPKPDFMKEPSQGVFARLGASVSSGVDKIKKGFGGLFKKSEPAIVEPRVSSIPADAQSRLDIQSSIARVELAAILPPRPTLAQRLRERVSDLTPNISAPRAASFLGGVAVAVGLTAISGNNSAPDDHVSATPHKSTQAKVDLPPPTTNMFTAIVPADKVTPQVAAEATPKAPEEKAQLVSTPAKTNIKTAKADFSAQATEIYKMPDTLKVQFNDGSTSRFDKDTWQKACDQIGKGNPICDELSLKNG